jgi:hypothetical protein
MQVKKPNLAKKVLIIAFYIVGFILLCSIGLLIRYSSIHFTRPINPVHVHFSKPIVTNISIEPKTGKVLIADTSGGGNEQKSKVFTAPNKWLIYFSFNANTETNVCHFNLYIYNANNTLSKNKPISDSGDGGAGTLDYDIPGKYFVKVEPSSSCSWKYAIRSNPTN